MKILKPGRLILIAVCAAMVCGCASTQQARLYVLHSPEPEVMVQGTPDNLAEATVVLERIRMPKYMDRPTILLKASDSELSYSEFRRWAGPLDNELSRTITMNLSRLLGASGVTGYRAALSVDHDYRVDIDIIEMTGMLEKEAVLVVRWQVTRGDEELTSAGMRLSSYREELAEESSYAEYVAAQSKMVMALSGDISNEIRAKAKK